MILWTAFALAASILLYWFLTIKLDFWKSCGLPSTRGFFHFGLFDGNHFKPTRETEIRRYKKLGRIYGTYEDGKPSISVAEPDLIKNLLVRDFRTFPHRKVKLCGDNILDCMLPHLQGKDHSRIRNALAPAFTSGGFRRMTTVIEECCETLRREIFFTIQNNSTVEMTRLFESFAMDITTKTVLSMEVKAYGPSNDPFVVNVRKLLEGGFPSKHLANQTSEYYSASCGTPQKIYALNFLKSVILEEIKERRKSNEQKNDFLQLFMKASTRSDENDNYGHTELNRLEMKEVMYPPKGEVGEILSTDELVAQCISFFTMGYNALVSVLSLAVYNLALNTECQNKLILEIQKTTENKKQMNFDLLNQMKYLNQVVCETLRLYPPVMRLERSANSQYVLGDTGVDISAGMMVTIPVCAIHTDVNHYLSPGSFDPRRFEDMYWLTRHPYAFIPFGAGQRNCIGMQLSLIEIKASLFHLLRCMRFEKSEKTKIPLEFFEGQDLLQPKSVNLIVIQTNLGNEHLKRIN